MDVREILRRMFHSFFPIFSGTVLSMYVYMIIFGISEVHVHSITALLVMAISADLAYFIFYSKKELSKRHMLMRYCIHLAAIISIMLLVASYMGWISWGEPAQVLVFIGLVVITYSLVLAIGVYQTKKLADKLTQKLKERYKG